MEDALVERKTVAAVRKIQKSSQTDINRAIEDLDNAISAAKTWKSRRGLNLYCPKSELISTNMRPKEEAA